MGNAYGFMEITGVVAATDALDIMCKAADVSLIFFIYLQGQNPADPAQAS